MNKRKKTKVVVEIRALDKKINEISDKRKFLYEDIVRLQKRREILKDKLTTKSKITDHARVRYLERILGWDWKEVDEEILKEEKHINKYCGPMITTIIPREE